MIKSEQWEISIIGIEYTHWVVTWCKPTSRNYVERESKLQVSIPSLCYDIREACVRERGKTVGVRRKGGHQENMAHQVNYQDSHGLTETEAILTGPE